MTDHSIHWTSEPTPRAETAIDLLELNPEETTEYAAILQAELMTVRELLHTALGTVATVTARLNQSQQTVIRLREELRASRRSVA